MIEIYGIENIKKEHQGAVVTLGFFDGLHKAHKSIINRGKEIAQKENTELLVFTFNRHPLEIINPSKKPKYILTMEEKKRFFKELGVDIVLFANFDSPFSRFSPENFIISVLKNRLIAKAVVAGYNYRFGSKRRGDVELLKKAGQDYNFIVEIVDEVRTSSRTLSSTLIRSLITEGKVFNIKKLLGRDYSIIGKVVRGKGRGRQIGFPTANLDFPEEKLTPKEGVYAGFSKLGEESLPSVINIGKRPTFNEEKLILESHILDFNEDIYDRELEVVFVKRIREEERFETVTELCEQINKDIKKSRKILLKFEG